MGFLYLITALLDLVVCILFIVQAVNFKIGASIFCAICWGVCFVLNLIMTIDDFKK